MGRFTDRVISSYLEEKEKNKSLGINLVDFNMLGEKSAKMVVSSASPIELDEIRDFVFKETDHKLLPYNDTFTPYDSHKDNFYASIIAYKSPIHYKDSEKCKSYTQISSNTYLDRETNQVWEKEDMDGKTFFVRKNNDQVDELLEDIAFTTSSVVRLSASNLDFTPEIEKGSPVEFFVLYEDGKPSIEDGIVNDINQDGTLNLDVNINDELSKAQNIPTEAVVKVKAQTINTKEGVVEYLKKAYLGTISKTAKQNEYSRQLDQMKK